jgi:hypothetical protein
MNNYKTKCKQIGIVFLLFCLIILGLKYKSRFNIDEFNSNVISKAAKELEACKDDYFINYISFKDSFFKKELRFIDQIKIIKNSKGQFEPVSVKFRNSYWGKSFLVNNDIYELIKKGVSNPIYFDNLEQLKKYELVKTLITNSYETPKKAGFIAIKNFTNIVYVFIIVNSNEFNNDCNEKEFNRILLNLYDFVYESNIKLF